MAILCDDCKNFKYTYDPQMSKVCLGTAGPLNILSCWAFSRKRGRAPSRLLKTASSSKKRKSRID